MGDDLSSDLASLKIDRGARNPDAPSPLRWVAYLAVIVGVVAVAYVFGLPQLEALVFKTEIEVTEVALVSPAQSKIELTSTGYVVAQKVSNVAPKVPGRVSKIVVKQGQEVKAGDLLFELDPADQDAAIAAAKSRAAAARARVATEKANVAQAKAQVAEATQAAKRERSLVQAGVSPKGRADDLDARVVSLEEAVRAAEARVSAANAEVRAAAAEVKALQVSSGNLTLTSPIDGRIVNKPPELGEFVGPQPAGISVDMGGIEVADFSTLAVETDVPEGRLHLVQLQGPCEIILDAYPDKRYRGTAYEITPKVNRAKATVTVKVKFVDETKNVLPDMSARVSFLENELDEQAMKEPPKKVVPSAAVVEKNGGKVVFVVDDGKVRLTPVQIGPAFGAGFELLNGPAAGTRLVGHPPDGLVDGQRVKEKGDG